MADSMEVGDRLRAARERAGMSQGDLAAKMGVHIATVTLWENRKNRRQMGTKHVRKAAEVLGLRVSELLGEQHHESHHSVFALDRAEEQLLRLFRLMSQKMQLFQLAQFVEVIGIGEANHAGSHGQRQDHMSVSGSESGKSG